MPWTECHVMDEQLRFVARRLEERRSRPDSKSRKAWPPQENVGRGEGGGQRSHEEVLGGAPQREGLGGVQPYERVIAEALEKIQQSESPYIPQQQRGTARSRVRSCSSPFVG